MVGNRYKAACKYCVCLLRAHYSDLRHHLKSAKHMRHALWASSGGGEPPLLFCTDSKLVVPRNTGHWATSLFRLVFSLKVKRKSEVDFFVRTQSELRTEQKTELIVWSEVRTESKVNLNYLDSVQMNLHATGRLIPYRLTFAERKTTTFSIRPNKPHRQEIRFISAKKLLLTFYLSITSLLTQYEF